ncbi:MAG: uracil-DNA glycosylase [Notoacmeibacter sp.]
MNTGDQLHPADIVRFYLEAGVDTPLLDEPQNRLLEAKAKIEPLAALQPAVQTRINLPLIDASTAQTLDELKAMIDAFEGCGLKKTAAQMVFSDGIAGSRVMLVGDVPGREDEIEGKPFAGKPGQLLDLMLKAIGLDRGCVYIAPSIYWRTPGGRPATNEEAMQCVPFIRRQIELAKPEMLVLIGGAAKTLLGSQSGIMQLRGHWGSVQLASLGTIPALPTLAPEYLMRNASHKRLAWADWLSLKLALGKTSSNG